MQFKPGIELALQPEMAKALPKIDTAYQEVVGHEAVLTSGTDGNHGPDSLHPAGLAVDVRTRDIRADLVPVVQSALRAHLNGHPDRDVPYNVVIEPNPKKPKSPPHIHVEFDPA